MVNFQLPPEPEPVQETPMDVSENVQDQTEFSQDQTAESALLNTEEPGKMDLLFGNNKYDWGWNDDDGELKIIASPTIS